MFAQLRLRPYYFIPLFVFLLLSLILCICTSKPDSFQLLNYVHTYWLDLFFMYYTIAGDGLVSLAVVILFLLLKRKKEGLTLLIAYITSGLFTQLLKNLFHQPRPNLYFSQLKINYNYFVEGVTLYSNNSFPSGHTASAFAMATVFALLYKQKSISCLAVILAVLVGYSRIYLAQHFLSDVLAGALTGILFGMLSYYFVWQHDLTNFSEALIKLKQKFFAAKDY